MRSSMLICSHKNYWKLNKRLYCRSQICQFDTFDCTRLFMIKMKGMYYVTNSQNQFNSEEVRVV